MLTYYPTGSRISGNGYSAEMFRDSPADTVYYRNPHLYAVRLSYAGRSAVVPCDPDGLNSSYIVAQDLMRAFVGTFHSWNVVRSRAEWLARSPFHAVIG